MAQTPRGRRPSGQPQQSYGNGQSPYTNQGGYIPQQNTPTGFRQTQASGNTTGNGGRKRTLTPAQRRAREQKKREILRRRRKHRRLLIAIIFLILLVAGFFGITKLNGSREKSQEPELDKLDQAAGYDEELDYDGPPVANIAFVGDISVSADQVKDALRSDNTYDFDKAFNLVSYHLKNADYAVGNFESTIVDGLSFGGQPYYNAPVQLAGSIHNAGIKLVSTANTVMLNNGIDGLVSTKDYLNQSQLETVGTYYSQEERDKDGGAYIRTIHNIKFAFLSYSKGTDAVTMPEGCEYAMNTLYEDYSDYWTNVRESQIRSDIQAAKDAGAEVIVALVHWGSEYGRSVSKPQQEIAELLMSCGVDAIIGTHSHIVSSMGFETVELADGTKKECFVAYGLGDFYTDPEQEKAQTAMILNLEFSKDRYGSVSITGAHYTPLYMNITEINKKRHFELMDVYDTLAYLAGIDELSSEQALLHNKLLDVLDDIHYYVNEEMDAGPSEEVRLMAQKAIDGGRISDYKIQLIQEEEAAEASALAERAAEEKNQQGSDAVVPEDVSGWEADPGANTE